MPIHAVDLAKEYQHSSRFKDMYQYIVQNQLSSSVPAQRREEIDAVSYVINELLVSTDTQEKIANMRPNIPLVLGEKF